MHEVWFDLLDVDFESTQSMFRSYSMHLWTVLELWFYCARYVSSTVPEVSFDSARGIFLSCSRYASTMLEVRFDRAPGMFPRCSRYISTVHDVDFDSAQCTFDRAR